MTPEDLVQAFARGLMQGLLSAPVAQRTEHRSTEPRVGRSNRSRGTTAVQVEPGTVPQPSFDTVDEPLPGFEGIPKATLRDMERAMERITRGNEPPPGFYRPEDADQRAPLS